MKNPKFTQSKVTSMQIQYQAQNPPLACRGAQCPLLGCCSTVPCHESFRRDSLRWQILDITTPFRMAFLAWVNCTTSPYKLFT